MVWQRGTLFRAARDVDVGPAELPWAWPVGSVYWAPNSDRRPQERATGVTPDGEIVPMSGVRMNEATRLGRHRYYAAVMKPQQTEYSAELHFSDGLFADALEEHVARHVGTTAS